MNTDTRKSLISKAIMAIVAILVAAVPAVATTYQMVSDETLARQADLILEGSVLTRYGVDGEPFPSTEYVVLPSRVIKGSLPDSTLVVRVIGGRGPSGERFEVIGAPRVEEGSEVLLFLRKNGDGSYSPLHLALGIFERYEDGESRLAVRQVGEEWSDGEARPVAVAREYQRFVDWVEGSLRGDRLVADYFVAAERPGRFEAAYTLEQHNGHNVRWFDFDSGTAVTWRIAGGGSGNDARALAAALDAWSSVQGPKVRLTYGGTTGARAGFETTDGLNTVLFGDPNDLMPGRFDCAKGGVVALGGWWSDEVMGTYQGESFYRIIEGDVVVNDGAECYFESDAKRAEAILAHEIGHALGLGHSCGDEFAGPCDSDEKAEAIMNARAHHEEAGAALKRDDREAVARLYGELVEQELEAPTQLKAKALKGGKVKLSWSDNSEGEEAFEIYSRVGKGEWELFLTVNGDRTGAKGKIEATGKVLFRARAIAAQGESPFSNPAKVRVR